jgi:deazaflavin-dependent oxidoreductase (nitroreductase family)
MLHLAGRKYWYAAVISHIGRHSGRQYATPVVAEPVSDGFLVPLPYGTQVDWLRNVQATGQATITAKGRVYDVCDPEILDAATASALLSVRRRRTFERFGIKSYLKVRTV